MAKLSELDEERQEKIHRELSDLFSKRTSSIEETLKSLQKTGLMINAGGITVLLPLLFKYLDHWSGYFLVLALLAFTVGILFVVVVQFMSMHRIASIAVGIQKASEDLRLDKISIDEWDAAREYINKNARPRVSNNLHYAGFVAWLIGVILVFLFLFSRLCSE